MKLFVLMHPEVEAGWVYLDRLDIEREMKLLIDKHPNIGLQKLEIKTFSTKDPKIISAIGKSYPEYLI